MAYIPEELIEDILLRLPVKPLLRFKSASKKCYSLISQDEEFAKRHLIKQSSSSSSSPSNNKNRLYFIKYSKGDSIIQFSEDEKTERHDSKECIIKGETIKLDPYGMLSQGRVLGSANGLICVDRGKRGCILWNPFTGDSNKISLPVTSSILPDCFPISFCYDSYSDDYKIVGTGLYYFSPIGMAIFSLKENTWTVHDQHKYRSLYDTTFFNGAFHWCVKAKIIAFDLAKEEFYHMEIPEETRSSYGIHTIFHSEFELFVWLGSLCLSARGSFWVMKEYGVAKSWIKLDTDHVKLPVGLCIEKLKDLIPHQESLISPKYFIKDQLQN